MWWRLPISARRLILLIFAHRMSIRVKCLPLRVFRSFPSAPVMFLVRLMCRGDRLCRQMAPLNLQKSCEKFMQPLVLTAINPLLLTAALRSEERRVGKECRCGWARYYVRENSEEG